MSKQESLPEIISEPKDIIVRIRRYSGFKGSSNYYHHADVLVKNEQEALIAAKEGRIRNWRWIDRFDTSPDTYERFESFGKIDPLEAKNVKRPLPSEKTLVQYATIETIIDDQGGGISYCSMCKTKIDLGNILKTMRCPNPQCDKPLKFSDKPWINTGGQDFY